MEQTYTQAQLVSFGNYLLNAPRLKDFVHPELEEPELIFQVYDADLANWSKDSNLAYNPETNIVSIPVEDTYPTTVYDGDEVYARGVVFTNADGSETFVEYGGEYDSSKIPANTDEHQG
jgi:hypothetical protein